MRDEATRARVLILTRNDPNRAFSEVLETKQTTSKEVVIEIEKRSKT